jgi:regulator of protease activity HflC (stomatin/prohibitin superfamily)
MRSGGPGTGVADDAALVVGAPFTWLLVGGLLLAVLAVYSVRVVPFDERLVVLRRGRAARTKGPGVVLLVPGLDHAVRVPMRARWFDVRVDATTRDAVTVVVEGTALVAVRDPARYALAVDSPASAVEWALEAGLREHVAALDLLELAGGRNLRPAGLAGRISERTTAWGVEVTDVELGPVEVRVDGDLMRWAIDRATDRPAGRTS